MPVNIHSEYVSTYSSGLASVELGEATQLCVFILGTGSFTLMYLGACFGYGSAVFVLTMSLPYRGPLLCPSDNQENELITGGSRLIDILSDFLLN